MWCQQKSLQSFYDLCTGAINGLKNAAKPPQLNAVSLLHSPGYLKHPQTPTLV